MTTPSFQLGPPIADEVVDAANRIHRSLGFAEPVDPAAIQRVRGAAWMERKAYWLEAEPGHFAQELLRDRGGRVRSTVGP